LWFSGSLQDATGEVNALAYSDGKCVWETAPGLKLARTDARVAVMSDNIFTVGGSRAPDFWLDDVEQLSGKSSQWKSAPRLPEGRTIEALTVVPCDLMPQQHQIAIPEQSSRNF